MIAALVLALPAAVFVAIRFKRLNEPSFLDHCVPYQEGEIPPQGWVLVEIQGKGPHWVNPALLKAAGPQTELTAEQRARIRAFKEVLGENDPSTLEEALVNFSRDQDPDLEIAVWERIAEVWSQEVAKRGAEDPAHAKLLYLAVLGCSFVGANADALLSWNPQLKGIADLESLAARYRGDQPNSP